jgi:hypothetical protein
MSDFLRRAFEKAAKELPESSKTEIGRWLLQLIEADEQRWVAALRDPDKLEQLASEASEEFQAGKAELLDPEKL